MVGPSERGEELRGRGTVRCGAGTRGPTQEVYPQQAPNGAGKGSPFPAPFVRANPAGGSLQVAYLTRYPAGLLDGEVYADLHRHVLGSCTAVAVPVYSQPLRHLLLLRTDRGLGGGGDVDLAVVALPAGYITSPPGQFAASVCPALGGPHRLLLELRRHLLYVLGCLLLLLLGVDVLVPGVVGPA